MSDAWKVYHTTGETSPTLFEQYCVFFYIPFDEEDKANITTQILLPTVLCCTRFRCESSAYNIVRIYFYFSFTSDDHWKMPRNFPHA